MAINEFEKVSYDQFKKDMFKYYPKLKDIQDIDTTLREMYNDIKLPKRATTGSAGYDFFLPFGISIDVGGMLIIPTGIRSKIKDNKHLQLHPRSGQGFKYHLIFANTVGIVDSDYYNSDNEGHIMIEIIYDGFRNDSLGYINIPDNNGNKKLYEFNKLDIPRYIDFDKGTGICQGIFVDYDLTENDDTNEIRNGGFGSTDIR